MPSQNPEYDTEERRQAILEADHLAMETIRRWARQRKLMFMYDCIRGLVAVSVGHEGPTIHLNPTDAILIYSAPGVFGRRETDPV